MASTFSSLKIELIGTGEKVGTWGTTTNINLGTALEEAITGSADVTFASGPVTLTLTDVNTTQSARNLRLNLIGTSGGAQNLIVPAIEKLYLINNACADAITVKNSTGTGVTVAAGTSTFVYNNATNVVSAVTAAPTTIPNLTGDVTSVGVATTLANAPVIAKVLTGYTSGAGTVAATDSILQAIQKLNGNDALKANLASPTFTGTVTIPTPFTLGAVSVLPTGTELNYVDGVTSNIQTQLNAKAATAGPTFTGTVTTDVLTTTGQFNLTGDLIKSRSESGADSLISVNNTSNTANSGVNFLAAVAGTSAGDAWSSYSVTGTAAWSVGIDNSDSDKFKISNFLSLGTSDCLSITTAGVVELPNGVSVTGGTAGAGKIWYGATNGLQFRGNTGSASDFQLFNAAGSVVLINNPTGTSHINMGGSFGRGSPVTKTANFTVAATENWLINNKSGSTCTVTLPTASAFPGREIMINNYQFYTVISAISNVVQRDGASTSTAILAATQGSWATLVSNGTNWVIMQGS